MVCGISHNIILSLSLSLSLSLCSVQKALDIIKMERNKLSHPRMSDLLPLATHSAENIIQDHLNRVLVESNYVMFL